MIEKDDKQKTIQTCSNITSFTQLAKQTRSWDAVFI